MDIAIFIFIFRNFLTRFTSLRDFFTVFEFSWFEMNDSTSVKFRETVRGGLNLQWYFQKKLLFDDCVLQTNCFWSNSFMILLKFSSKETSSSGINSGGTWGGETKPSPFVLLITSLSGSARDSLFTIKPRSTSASILFTRK